MRRALARAARNKGALAKLVAAGDLARLPEARREAVRQDLEREDALLRLMEGLGSDLDEIQKKLAESQGGGS